MTALAPAAILPGGDEAQAATSKGNPAAGPRTLSRLSLTTLVVGSMVGGGIFSLPQAFGRSTGVIGALIAWGIAGLGMLMLARAFQTLAERKPDLDAGIVAYARAGFGPYLGFLSALGYWASAFLGLVTFLVLSQSTLGAFVPALGEGDTPAAVAVAGLILWGVHALLLRGVKEATALNTIVTVAKIVPIVVFLAVVAVAFRPEVFAANLIGAPALSGGDLFGQVRGTLLIVVFVFLGIEGASVYSRYARRREDVGQATLLGFGSVLALFMLVTILSYGILPRAELAALRNPSMAGVLEAVIGRQGAIFVSLGVLISVLGAYLSWSLLAAEVLSASAAGGIMPAFLGRQNAAGAPAAALWLTNGAVFAVLLATLAAESALRLAIELTSAMSLLPYLLVGAYAVKLARTGEGYAGTGAAARRADLIAAALATGYAAGMLCAAGPKYWLLSTLIYAPGTLLFLQARREQSATPFTAAERCLALLLGAALLTAVIGLCNGAIRL
ncbi:Arginine/ornithine antiporter [Methylobacterium organophilum]|uniref:Arginine/ornithine antiporter n=1 Tax=Methylobacterium organophilum TaxID=410 RepID=A0ABQ4T892_METOR|nr:basic amino acid/polyamine antiporter [Methylobacterium organophilum]GJE27912.1 Arginine/ornithine antiporter [Methylobacterium organophilum]